MKQVTGLGRKGIVSLPGLNLSGCDYTLLVSSRKIRSTIIYWVKIDKNLSSIGMRSCQKTIFDNIYF